MPRPTATTRWCLRAHSVATTRGPRALPTGILFLLLPDEVSAWHRVRSDELWFHHRSSPLELTLGGSGGRPGPARSTVLGPGFDFDFALLD